MKDRNNCHGVKNADLSLRIRCNFSKINSAFFCPAALVKVALKKFKRMVLVHCFGGFFVFKIDFPKCFF